MMTKNNPLIWLVNGSIVSCDVIHTCLYGNDGKSQDGYNRPIGKYADSTMDGYSRPVGSERVKYV